MKRRRDSSRWVLPFTIVVLGLLLVVSYNRRQDILDWIGGVPAETMAEEAPKEVLAVAAPPLSEPAAPVNEELSRPPEPEAPTLLEPPAQPPAVVEARVRELARGSTRHPLLSDVLRQGHLVELAVLVVNQIADGNSPRLALGFLAPAEAFRARTTDEEHWEIDPASYERYDAIVSLFTSIPAAAYARAYLEFLPELERTHRSLEASGPSFDARLGEAIEIVLATPTISRPPRVRPEVWRYEYEDPALQALPDAQRQLLRAGPRNVARTKDHVRKVADEIRRMRATRFTRADGE